MENMILHINRHIFSIGGKYDITDDQGALVFKVIGQIFTIGHKLELQDPNGNLLAKIHQRILTFVPEYDILVGDVVVATVQKQLFTPLHPLFTVEGPNAHYEMEGDWINWNYEIRANGVQVAQISKQLAFVQDRYAMSIVDGADVAALVCMAIIMDEVAHPQSNRS